MLIPVKKSFYAGIWGHVWMEVRGFLSTKGMYQPLFWQYMTYQSKAVLQHSDQKAQNNNTVQGGGLVYMC